MKTRRIAVNRLIVDGEAVIQCVVELDGDALLLAHLGDEVVLRLLGGEAGDPLQHLRLGALDALDLLLLLVRLGVLLGQGLLFPLDVLRLAV